ncbi:MULTISPECIES: CDP-alcohol phosphatidyltransferase family protein [unclassified Stappia]|uniref:CDP-alcohol phosphatidyltransferase family protein n=1 Tax=unclassified Stappia TaxID=2629676 RepID=UPI00164386E1|nr:MULTISPECIES: CDP-alcohol phosphatidyltransferase family protein [unclassified Stappia]
MATVYDLKSRFQDLLRPLVHRLASAGITANQVTLAALALSAIAGLAIALWPAAGLPLALLPLVLFVRMALNAMDGMLAREHHQQSALGAVLNELGDVASDLALYLPFALVPGVSPVAVVGLCLLAVISEMMGVVGVQIGASRRYDGPLGKSDRAVLFGTLGLLLGLGIVGPAFATWVLAIALLPAALTIFNRARKALAEVREGRP